MLKTLPSSDEEGWRAERRGGADSASPHFSPVSEVLVGRWSFQAPKGRDNLAQADGLGFQIVTRPSPEGAIHETILQTNCLRRIAKRKTISTGVGAPLGGFPALLPTGWWEVRARRPVPGLGAGC